MDHNETCVYVFICDFTCDRTQAQVLLTFKYNSICIYFLYSCIFPPNLCILFLYLLVDIYGPQKMSADLLLIHQVGPNFHVIS